MTLCSTGRRLTASALLLTLALVAAACSQGGGRAAGPTTTRDEATGGPTTASPRGRPAPGGIRIEVLSSQPDRVSGDDARIRVTPAGGSGADELRVMIGDKDVTRRLTRRRGALEGVVTGFVEGTNTLVATTTAATTTATAARASLRVRAWPLEGPMISGPHLPLLACSTEAAGLFPPTDTDCSAPTRVTWRYLDDAHQLHDLASASDGGPLAVPPDLGHADIGGQRVPLYVRYEQGVINRSIYEIATIDPKPGGRAGSGSGSGSGSIQPSTAAWNGILLYRTGDGCGITYGQGTSATTALEPAALAKGYAVATATANTAGVQCNDVLAAETTMMVKERVIEELGRPRFTIGEGAGHGAAQLHLMVQNYPGLVDGVVAELPFPDTFTVASGATDCGLLLQAFDRPELAGLNDSPSYSSTGRRWTTSPTASVRRAPSSVTTTR